MQADARAAAGRTNPGCRSIISFSFGFSENRILFSDQRWGDAAPIPQQKKPPDFPAALLVFLSRRPMIRPREIS
jgi:hypothetical protein